MKLLFAAHILIPSPSVNSQLSLHEMLTDFAHALLCRPAVDKLSKLGTSRIRSMLLGA